MLPESSRNNICAGQKEANYSLQNFVSAGLLPSNKSKGKQKKRKKKRTDWIFALSGKSPNMHVAVPEGTWIGG